MSAAKIENKAREEKLLINAGEVNLQGDLIIPEGHKGIVLFAHGSGSSRFSPRNRYVAGILNDAKVGTLLFDLLTKEEERLDAVTGGFRFDIGLLAKRLKAATEWIAQNNSTKGLRVGYFGASTGAAAALVAAAELPEIIRAVVSRGGRPDLADKWLSGVRAPTLLIVGGDDLSVIDMNKEAMEKMSAEKKLVIVPKASHLFEEPGKLKEIAFLARSWFLEYL